MKPDRPCQDFSDLTPHERRQCWTIAAIGIAVLFALTIADALLM